MHTCVYKTEKETFKDKVTASSKSSRVVGGRILVNMTLLSRICNSVLHAASIGDDPGVSGHPKIWSTGDFVDMLQHCNLIS